MESGANYIVQSEDYLTKITINDAERKHTGMYHIHAKNESGSDEAEVEIVVLGESRTKQKHDNKKLLVHFKRLQILEKSFMIYIANVLSRSPFEARRPAGHL